MNNQNEEFREKVFVLLLEMSNQKITEKEELKGEAVTREDVENIVDKSAEYFKKEYELELSPEEIGRAIAKLETTRIVRVAEPLASLKGSRVAPWPDYYEREWNLWSSYKRQLQSQGRAQEIISDNEKVIDEVLKMSGDTSNPGPWLRKGLVMGNVQSGKTMNFIGLINKAVDVGYHIIIVLGGHLNELRQQTQERVDEGAIGQNTGDVLIKRGKATIPQRNFGVAQFDVLSDRTSRTERPHAGTTWTKDFSVTTASSLALNINASTPTVFVIKKNVRIMRNLHEWLESKLNDVGRSLPMLLIDDEADYASINTRLAQDEVAATNEQILNLLNTFQKRTYVGYTATPFANVFIPTYERRADELREDLFPADFMLKMPLPDNYCGQDHFFPEWSDEGLEADESRPVREIDDYLGWLELKHKKDAEIEFLPQSLQDAILVFTLVTAIRALRGDQKVHNTMLVNVSRFNNVQEKVTLNITQFVQEFSEKLRAFGAAPSQQRRRYPVLNRLEELFEIEYGNCEFQYEDVLQVAISSVERIKTIMVNGLASSRRQSEILRLDYRAHSEEGLWVMAVGGQKL